MAGQRREGVRPFNANSTFLQPQGYPCPLILSGSDCCDSSALRGWRIEPDASFLSMEFLHQPLTPGWLFSFASSEA